MSESFQAYWDRESNIKATVKQVLQNLGYQVTKREYALPIEGGYRRYPDVYAKKGEKVIVVECKGGLVKRRFYHVVNALGQVLVVKAHYPKFEVAVAIPER